VVQVGWVKFSKEEESILVKSYLLGLFLGLLLGFAFNYLLDFPTMPKQLPSSFLEQLASSFLTSISFEGFGWITTILLFLYFFRKKQQSQFERDVYRILSASFILFPVLLFYAASIYCAILIPFNTFFAWLGFRILYGIGALLFFPFMILFIAIFVPDSKPGKALRRSIRRLKRSIRKGRER
jgi:MFS family permease